MSSVGIHQVGPFVPWYFQHLSVSSLRKQQLRVATCSGLVCIVHILRPARNK